MKSIEEWVSELFKKGTPQCGVTYGILGFALGFMLLFLGFFKTLFVVVLCALGVFLGCVKDKGEFIKGIINKLFPPRMQ